MPFYRISTDCMTDIVEADSADDAAARFAESNGLPRVTDLRSLLNAIIDSGGHMTMSAEPGPPIARVSSTDGLVVIFDENA